MERYSTETLVPKLTQLLHWLCRDGQDADHFVGDCNTHVDYLAFTYLDEIDAFFPDTLALFPEPAKFRMRIETGPWVSVYLRSPSRPYVFGMCRSGPKVDPRSSIPIGTEFHNPWTDPIPLA
jgi:hypothetical protein